MSGTQGAADGVVARALALWSCIGAVLGGAAEYAATGGVSGLGVLISGAVGLVGGLLAPRVARAMPALRKHVSVFVLGLELAIMSIDRRDIWIVVLVWVTSVLTILLIASHWDYLSRVAGDWLEAQRAAQDRLLTRPLCPSGDCPNFSFQVTECELHATLVGGLALGESDRARGNIPAATEHFRGCLIDRGLSWEPCKRGEPECRLLRPYRNTAMPSFVAE